MTHPRFDHPQDFTPLKNFSSHNHLEPSLNPSLDKLHKNHYNYYQLNKTNPAFHDHRQNKTDHGQLQPRTGTAKPAKLNQLLSTEPPKRTHHQAWRRPHLASEDSSRYDRRPKYLQHDGPRISYETRSSPLARVVIITPQCSLYRRPVRGYRCVLARTGRSLLHFVLGWRLSVSFWYVGCWGLRVYRKRDGAIDGRVWSLEMMAVCNDWV